MHARRISILLLTFALACGARTQAQAPEGGEPEAPAADDKPKEPIASPKKLPVEDPTIHMERAKELTRKKEPDADEEPAAETEAEPEPEAVPEADQTVGALPIEDPTLHTTDDEEVAPADEPDAEKPEEDDASDWGQPVKVAYGYQGGLIVAVDDWFYLTLSGLLQARYAVNYRTKPPTNPETGIREQQVTQGFDVARARFQLGIGLTEFVAFYMRIGVVAGGNFSFQRAFIDLKWKYLRLRAGLFLNELIAEDFINPNDLLFNDYTILTNVYSAGSSKGVMLTYLRKRFSLNLGYSDGLRTGFSEIRSPQRADFAVTVRSQYAWGERGLSGFNRLVARRGTPLGIRLGGAVHYQDGGRSQGTAPVKIAIGTIDLSLRGNGWSVLVASASGQDARVDSVTNVSSEVVTGSVSVMGGYFVLEDVQIFGQYSFVAEPRFQGERPPSDPNFPAAEPSDFHAFGVGLSYFIVPRADNVKLSTDFQYFLGRELGSTVPASPLNNIQPNNDGSQFFWRIQISAAF